MRTAWILIVCLTLAGVISLFMMQDAAVVSPRPVVTETAPADDKRALESAPADDRRVPESAPAVPNDASRSDAADAIKAAPVPAKRRCEIRFTDKEGKPLPDVVVLRAPDEDGAAESLADCVMATSDGDGKVELYLGTDRKLVAYKAGYSMSFFFASELGSNVTRVMEAAPPARFFVHRSDGKGIPDAVVTITVWDFSSRIRMPAATTGSDGMVVLPITSNDVAKWRWSKFNVIHPSYIPLELTIDRCPVREDGVRLLHLFESSALEIHVLSGAPKDGCVLRVLQGDSNEAIRVDIDSSGKGRIDSTSVGENEFVVYSEDPAYDTHVAKPRPKGYDNFYPHRFYPSKDPPRRLEVVMGPRKGVIRCQLVNAGTPVVGWTYWAKLRILEDKPGCNLKGAIDAEGKFEITGLMYGTWELGVVGPKGRIIMSEGVLKRYPDPAEQHRLSRVPLAEPKIIANIFELTVKIDPSDPTGELEWDVSDTTGSLSIRVVDESGAPIPGAVVETCGTSFSVFKQKVGGDGILTVPGLTPGRCDVQADAPGYKRGFSGRVEVLPRENRSVEIVLSPSRTVELAFVGENDQPLPKVPIKVHEILKSKFVANREATELGVTNADGVLTLTKVGAGSYVAKIPKGAAEGRTYKGKLEIPFTVDATTDRVTLKLTHVLAVRGIIQDELGYRAEAGSIVIKSTGPESRERTGKVQNDGTFEIVVSDETPCHVTQLAVAVLPHEPAGTRSQAELVAPVELIPGAPPKTIVFRRKSK